MAWVLACKSRVLVLVLVLVLKPRAPLGYRIVQYIGVRTCTQAQLTRKGRNAQGIAVTDPLCTARLSSVHMWGSRWTCRSIVHQHIPFSQSCRPIPGSLYWRLQFHFDDETSNTSAPSPATRALRPYFVLIPSWLAVEKVSVRSGTILISLNSTKLLAVRHVAQHLLTSHLPSQAGLPYTPIRPPSTVPRPYPRYPEVNRL